ncbi:hypothetical protein Zmor_014833 [Zophobas morio]|uniref:Uncharacterized protein n=1 Tax=Zophobas morio TaxID=2755281 RepID=A0AA38II76_9CUCU|nr:hypothetical protein Zmor_014833 [Zophobas morio]
MRNTLGTNDPSVDPNTFNNYFVNIASDILSKLSPVQMDPIKLMLNEQLSNKDYFEFLEVSVIEVRSTIKNLKNNNSRDIYGLHTLLKRSLIQLSHH